MEASRVIVQSCRAAWHRQLASSVSLSRNRFYTIPATTNYWAWQRQESYAPTSISKWRESFPSLSAYSDAEVQSWRRAFDVLDSDRDEYISFADMLKHPIFTIEKTNLFRQHDRDHNNMIDFGEFVEAMHDVDIACLKEDFSGFDNIDFQLEFDKYAVASEGSSKSVGLDGVKRLLHDHDATVVSETDAARLLRAMDVNGDGRVDLEDFKKWLSGE